MHFNDIIGQTKTKTALFAAWRSQKLPHALLLIGKPGTGAFPMAWALAQFVLCENKQADGPCGSCSSCLKVGKLAHPDLHLSFPTIVPKPGSKASSKAFLQEFRAFMEKDPYGTTFDWLQYIQAENKQGNITAEECREIIDELNLTSFEGGYKIQIIWRPEYLGKEGNILLKLIEEPPRQTLLLMVAEKPEEILPTLLSRTQQLHLSPLGVDEIAEALCQREGTDKTIAMQVARLGEGSYSRAKALLEQSEQDLLALLRDWFNALFTHNGALINKWIEDMGKMGREQQKNFLLFAQQMLAHALRHALIPGYAAPLLAEEAAFIGKIAQRKYPIALFESVDQWIGETIYHIGRNAHPKTQLLSLSIKMQYAFQGTPLPA